MIPFYSATTNSFYNSDWRKEYDEAGTWPADAIEVSEEIFLEFALNDPPQGKMRAPNDVGMPSWVDIPPLTKEELAVIANSELSRLISLATQKIQTFQDAVDLGISTPEEEAALLSWKRYRVELSRLPNMAGWPSDIQWPVQPEGN